MEYQLTQSLNRLLDNYFDDFLKGNRSLYDLMPDIYSKIKSEFETDLIEKLSIDWYENERLIADYKSNINKWSIARNYKQTKEITDFLYTNKGNLTDDVVKKFKDGNKARFNTSWLDREKQYLTNTINSINAYETYPDDSYLEFRTSADERVRHSHAELNGLTLPKNDPQWNYLMPPIDYGCRCRVIPVYNTKASSQKDIDKKIDRYSDLSGTNQTDFKSREFAGFSGKIFNEKETYFKGINNNLMGKISKTL